MRIVLMFTMVLLLNACGMSYEEYQARINACIRINMSYRTELGANNVPLSVRCIGPNGIVFNAKDIVKEADRKNVN